jgi:hypothetical protein
MGHPSSYNPDKVRRFFRHNHYYLGAVQLMRKPHRAGTFGLTSAVRIADGFHHLLFTYTSLLHATERVFLIANRLRYEASHQIPERFID